MKTFAAISLGLLSTALAAPAIRRSEYDIPITFTNDQESTPLRVTRSVASGGFANSLEAIFGPIEVTSAQLIPPNANVKFIFCELQVDGVYFQLTTNKDFVDIDGTPANPKSLTGGTVACWVEGEQSVKIRRSEFDIAVQLFDDSVEGNGHNDVRGVPSGGFENSVQAVFAGSRLDVGGRILASSAQLQMPGQAGDRDINCHFTLVDGSVVYLNQDVNFADLNNVPGAQQVDITDATIACVIEGEQVVQN